MQEIRNGIITGFVWVGTIILAAGLIIWLLGVISQVLDYGNGGHNLDRHGRPATAWERLSFYSIWPWRAADWITAHRKSRRSNTVETEL